MTTGRRAVQPRTQLNCYYHYLYLCVC